MPDSGASRYSRPEMVSPEASRRSRLRAWLAQRDLALLTGALLLVALGWIFVETADEVLEGETQDLDDRILMALRNHDNPADPVGPAWLEELGRDMTAMGGVLVLTTITAAVIGFLLIQRKRHAALFLAVATGGALVVSLVLKSSFDRPRPDLVPHLSNVMTSSFPSGHSMLSAAIYLTLGAMLARMSEQRRLKLYFLGLAMMITMLVGVSRVYMGVHYPTDVLAGWTIGLAWALLCWLAARRLQRAGRVEPDAGQ
jgi:undecaprenyl-diphosphatase